MVSGNKIKPPWTPEQVKALNNWQNCGVMHPFTCGGERGDAAHRKYAKEHAEDAGQLIATEKGWVCPVCDYTQDWAHNFMAEPVQKHAPAYIGRMDDEETTGEVYDRFHQMTLSDDPGVRHKGMMLKALAGVVESVRDEWGKDQKAGRSALVGASEGIAMALATLLGAVPATVAPHTTLLFFHALHKAFRVHPGTSGITEALPDLMAEAVIARPEGFQERWAELCKKHNFPRQAKKW